jgi:nicotinamide mononucleotide adenylyltransferase
MCELAVQQDSNWLMVDPWEAIQPEYMPTALVLDHFNHEINEVLGGAERPDGTRVPVKISLLAGADLIGTMSTPGVWSEEDLDHILRRYGTFIVERSGTDMEEALASLQPWRDQIYVIPQLLQNDISSTKIRLFLRRGLSVQYLIPAPVVEYIEQNGLFEQPHEDDGTSSVNEKGKSKSAEGSGHESSAVADSGSKS